MGFREETSIFLRKTAASECVSETAVGVSHSITMIDS